MDLGATEGDHPVDRIGFGYVNRFTFGADDFDLSKYFAINVGVDVGAEDAGLLGLSAAFRFFDEEKTMYLSVELSAEAVPSDQRVIGVTTKVFAEAQGRGAERPRAGLLLVLNHLARLVMRPRTPISDEALDAAAEIQRLRFQRTG